MSTPPTSTPSSVATSSSSSSPSSAGPLIPAARRCEICFLPAYSNNYGVLSCDACKMFFRRIILLNKEYKCKANGQCYQQMTTDKKRNKCKGCRYQRCVERGMIFLSVESGLNNTKDVQLATLIGKLVASDKKRCQMMQNQFTDDNLSLVEILEKGKMRLRTRNKKRLIPTHDWSFFGIYTSLEFLTSFEFMSLLSTDDKVILLKKYCVKASLFASAMRAMKENRERLMTVDGQDVYPDNITQSDHFSEAFLNEIRSLLVCKIRELELTSEEFALCNAIFFCAADPSQSEQARTIITNQQQIYTAALMRYCLIVHENGAASRFSELLSLVSVIFKTFSNVEWLTHMFNLAFPNFGYRRLVTDLL